MPDDFETLIEKHRARMRELSEAFHRDGMLRAVSVRDPSYSIALTRNASSSAPWRVTSFQGKEPTGHREYDRLEGGGPTQNAFQEFASDDFQLLRKPLTGRNLARKTKEAEDAIKACADAIAKIPDEAGKRMFERSKRIWQRRLRALKS